MATNTELVFFCYFAGKGSWFCRPFDKQYRFGWPIANRTAHATQSWIHRQWQLSVQIWSVLFTYLLVQGTGCCKR